MYSNIKYAPVCLLTNLPFVSHLGKKNNFKSYNETVSSSLGVPYDYGSVMHYGKTFFSKGSEPTIVTKIPEFLDVIGQRMEFSDSDLLKLNRLYNCSKFLIKHHYFFLYFLNKYIDISLTDKINTCLSHSPLPKYLS